MTASKRPLKPGWEDFAACVRRRGLSPLKHFTAVENLPGIVRPKARGADRRPLPGGLYSRKGLRDRGLVPVRLHGWGGKSRALEDYICLSYHLPAGMIRREPAAPAVLLVSNEAIGWEGTCFSRTNSASRAISAEEIRAWHDLEAFENLFRHAEGNRLRYRLAEILVPDHIPFEYLLGIVLPDTPEGHGMNRRLMALKWLRRLRGAWYFPRVRFGPWQSFA